MASTGVGFCLFHVGYSKKNEYKDINKGIGRDGSPRVQWVAWTLAPGITKVAGFHVPAALVPVATW